MGKKLQTFDSFPNFPPFSTNKRNNFTHRKRTKLPRTKRNGERDGRKQLFAMQEASRPLDPSYISQVGIFRNF